MTESETPTRPRIKWRELVAIWLVITVISIVGSLVIIPHLMPRAAADTMHLVILTMLVFSISAAPVGAMVWATMAYGVRNWRHTGNQDEPPPDGPPIRGNSVVTIVWTSVSSLLCIFLCVWGLSALAADNAAAGKATMHVDVQAQQWIWTFHYPGTNVTSESLYLPEGRTVTFDVTSLDVTHGFWIVQMGIKIDANPGEVTTISVTPDKLGTFDVRCSELCGLYHAFMTAQVHIVTPAQYSTWMRAQSGGASA